MSPLTEPQRKARDRNIVRARYWRKRGLSYAAIAAKLDVAPSTVNNWLDEAVAERQRRRVRERREEQ